MIRQFRGAVGFTLGCLVLAALYGWRAGGGWGGAIDDLWIVLVLAVLEVSLSFDNAVVNAAVLERMAPVWRARFLTWGIVVAVFGTRVLFPLAIVGFTAGLGPVAAVHLSLEQYAQYEAIVGAAHVAIAGFGGAFLAMVGLGFFMDTDKALHWLAWPERALVRGAAFRAARVGLVLLALLAMAQTLPQGSALTLLMSGIIGIVAFVAVDALGAALEASGGGEAAAGARAVAGAVVKGGLGTFLYLNLLDISFSLDGVIGAFALSSNMIIIALGLSVGAIFVRSLTMVLVSKGALAEYRYLEHGAFWAILALAGIMLASARWQVPEAVTGLVGAVLIGGAVWSSWRAGRRAN